MCLKDFADTFTRVLCRERTFDLELPLLTEYYDSLVLLGSLFCLGQRSMAHLYAQRCSCGSLLGEVVTVLLL